MYSHDLDARLDFAIAYGLLVVGEFIWQELGMNCRMFPMSSGILPVSRVPICAGRASNLKNHSSSWVGPTLNG